MSGLLYLAGVGGFILIIYWAFKNDAMKPDETGSGILAMRVPEAAAKQKSVPKWKKAGVLERPRLAAAKEKKPAGKSRWQRSLHYGKGA